MKEGIKDDNNKLPLGIVVTKQFPNAIKALAECSQYGHEKYNLGDNDWLNFLHLENAEQRLSDAFFRHYFEKNEFDEGSKLLHLKHAVWNLMAELEIQLRKTNGK
jgi:hypothetical protein